MIFGAQLMLTALVAGQAPDLLIDAEDPWGDSDGPGNYTAPLDADISAEDFDLRRFVARVEGGDIVFEVTLGSIIRAPASAWRDTYTPADLDNGIYLQNIDIYIDTDPSDGSSGVSTSIPGRRVAFEEGRTWKRAIVFTPQPALVASVLKGALGDAAWRVRVVTHVQSRGKTLVGRVPIFFFGATPSRAWEWSVQVSGAAWTRNFYAADLLKGTAQADALTMAVSTTAERWQFGGAKLDRAHPQVVDILVPQGESQHAILGKYDAEKGIFAKVPFVASSSRVPVVAAKAKEAAEVPTTAALPASDPQWKVVEVAKDLVTIRGEVAGLGPMMLGEVLDAAGLPVARVVVRQVLPSGVLADAIDHSEKILVGSAVTFRPRSDGKDSPSTTEPSGSTAVPK